MPILTCSALTCVYNKDELCSKGDILVGGNDASTPDQTCCTSFQERTNVNLGNSEGCGCDTIHVDCEAKNCMYNEECKCDASKIGIGGSSARNSQETRCGTFHCK